MFISICLKLIRPKGKVKGRCPCCKATLCWTINEQKTLRNHNIIKKNINQSDITPTKISSNKKYTTTSSLIGMYIFYTSFYTCKFLYLLFLFRM